MTLLYQLHTAEIPLKLPKTRTKNCGKQSTAESFTIEYDRIGPHVVRLDFCVFFCQRQTPLQTENTGIKLESFEQQS